MRCFVGPFTSRVEVLLVASALVALVSLAACSPHHVTHDPRPPIALPGTYLGQASAAPAPDTAAARALPEKWWTELGDTALDALVTRSLRDNLAIRAAWARVAQSRALLAQASGGKFPEITYSASAARQKQRFNLQQEITIQTNLFAASLAASYEVDLWRRLASQGQAAALDALASRDDVEAIAITLAAEVSEAWLDVISQRAQRQLVTEQEKTNQDYLELVKVRFEKGLASSLDVYQQEELLITTRSQLALIDSTIELALHRLAVLVGAPPGTITPASLTAAELPALPALPSSGIPAQLLERRPDVRAARRRVEAADYRVAVAVAARLPTLRLTGTTGLQSRTLADLVATPLWSLLAAVTGPLFDGGRRKAEVTRQKAVVEERLYQYGQIMLEAMVEVEGALTQERQQTRYIADLEQALALDEQALAEAEARYRQGLIDYLPVLTALQRKYRAELGLVGARRQLLSYRIQLCRALGGSWTQSLAEPVSG